MILVCDSCLTASCWHGEFMCEDAKHASTVEKSKEELDALGLEHPDNYSETKLQKITGES